jgi:hypothetical protein
MTFGLVGALHSDSGGVTQVPQEGQEPHWPQENVERYFACRTGKLRILKILIPLFL